MVRPVGGHAVNLLYTIKNVYDVRSDDVWWAASDLGWVVGHSYTCYGPLLKGATSILYEVGVRTLDDRVRKEETLSVFQGKPVATPDASSYFRVIRDYGVSGVFSSPTAMRVIRKEVSPKLGSK